MDFHESRNEKVYTSPIKRRMKRDKRKAKERARKRVLEDHEIRAVWKACDDAGQFGRLMQLCLLTAQRRGKVAAMRRSDIQDGVWIIPAEDREKGTAGELVLPKMATEILAKQKPKVGNPFVFAGRGTKAFNAFSQGKAELDALLPGEMEHWTIHDLRRTARTIMSALVRPDIAERVLGHEQQGVQPVYDRHKYRAEMAQALKALAGKIDSIVNARPNVVPISKGRRTRKLSSVSG